MNCRFCNEKLEHVFIDLYNAPASNSFLEKEKLNEPEMYFPLKVYTCSKCFLVQVDEYKKSEDIFSNEYVYFSSFSKSWLLHAKKYTDLMTRRFELNEDSQVVEIASNDGYLLQYFKEKNIKVLGIEPTSNTAAVAIGKGIDTVVDFFGTRLAARLVNEKSKADLLLGNNVLAHVPDINDFVKGMKIMLAEKGVITMEFPHLYQLVKHTQFDTVYHEHFSYLSFFTVRQIFRNAGLELFDVEEIPTHGGSLRIYAKHSEDLSKEITGNVTGMLEKEHAAGMNTMAYYTEFPKKAFRVKVDLLKFLLEQKENNKKVAGYGAAAKGNTLLNFSGVKQDLVDYVVDANPVKQGKFLPGSHIPVVNEAFLKEDKPDFIIIFPWNLKDEITEQLSYVKEWGGRFVIAIPQLTILS